MRRCGLLLRMCPFPLFSPSCAPVSMQVVAEVARLGFERDMLLESLRSRQQNKATVTYWLMCDNKCANGG